MKKRVKKNKTIFLVTIILIIIVILLIGIFLIYKIPREKSNINSQGSLPTLGIHNNNQELGIFSGGDGSPQNPYQISTCQELQNINNDLAANYVLSGNIDCSDTRNWNSGIGFIPIGSNDIHFSGMIDGKGFNVTGVYIRGSYSLIAGLIYSNSGTIINLGLKDVDIVNPQASSSLIGWNKGYIKNCFSTGNISASVMGSILPSGGLVGYNDVNGYILNSYSKSNLNVPFGGGLVGKNFGKITNCFSGGEINAVTSAGGLVNSNYGSVINSYSYENINLPGNIPQNGFVIGGLVANGGNIQNSYFTGNINIHAAYPTGINTPGSIGGLVGMLTGNISNSFFSGTYSYSTNKPGIQTYVGGISGQFGVVVNSYYNNQIPANCIGNGGNFSDCIRIDNNQAYFYNINNPPINSWDFTNVWSDSNNNNNYPLLKWQYGINTDICNNNGVCENYENCISCQQDCICSSGKLCQPTNPNSDSKGCVCSPNWQCSDWDACIGYHHNRNCTDINNCGDNSGKPSETESCNCVPDWQCSSWSNCIGGQHNRTCTDVYNCGINTNKPIENECCITGANSTCLIEDTNGNGIMDDNEILSGIQMWINA